MKLSSFPRRLAEYFSRGVSLKRTLNLADSKLVVWITPDSQLKYFFGDLDHKLIAVADKFIHKNDVVFDIGANCGVFGFASHLKGAKKVFFFEPDLFLAKLIEKTIDFNELTSGAAILPIALSDEVIHHKFEIASRGRASNSLINLGRKQKGGIRAIKSVVTNTLDNYSALGSKNCFLKIDVEGAELMVIRGSLQFIQTHSPTIFVEVSDTTCNEIHDLLGSMGYKSKEIYPNNYIFINDMD